MLGYEGKKMGSNKKGPFSTAPPHPQNIFKVLINTASSPSKQQAITGELV